MTTYRIVPERSRVHFDGSTNLHPVHGEGDGLTGSIDVAIADGAIDLSQPPKARIEFDVERLHSSFTLFERELQRRIDARRFPTITGEVELAEAAGPGRYHVRGDVTFHGVTKTAEGDVTVAVDADGTLRVDGQQVFDIRDYGIEPPKLLLLKANPDVTIRVEVVAAPE
ncbi:MAG TPA: YceI family protein [Actinomycetota bacterium]